MSTLDRLYVEADQFRNACGWLLEQWLSDVDPEHADWCLAGLRHEDPDLFAVLDAISAEDIGEPLFSSLGGEDRGSGGRDTAAAAQSDGALGAGSTAGGIAAHDAAMPAVDIR